MQYSTLGFVQLGIDKQLSAKCKPKHWFKLDE